MLRDVWHGVLTRCSVYCLSLYVYVGYRMLSRVVVCCCVLLRVIARCALLYDGICWYVHVCCCMTLGVDVLRYGYV